MWCIIQILVMIIIIIALSGTNTEPPEVAAALLVGMRLRDTFPQVFLLSVFLPFLDKLTNLAGGNSTDRGE